MQTTPKLGPGGFPRHGPLIISLVLLAPAWPQAGAPGDLTFLDEEVPDQFSWKLTLQPTRPWPPDTEARVVFNWQEQGNGYAVLLTAEALRLVKVRQGQVSPLGNECDFRPGQAEEVRLCLKRRDWKIGVIANGVQYITAYDEEFTGGRVGYGGAGEEATSGVQKPLLLHFEESLLQPVEDLYFTDDFMRVESAEGGWERVSGEWTLSGAKNPKMDPHRSANPFVYRATGKRALTTAGYWFWDDYQFDVTVKPVGTGAVGVVAYYQDEGNYLLFRWRAAGGTAACQLVQVVNGEERSLTTAEGGFEPGQWYQLGVRLHEGVWEGLIDGEVVLTARQNLFGQGLFGLFSEDLEAACFDDVRVEPWKDFHDDFTGPHIGGWIDAGGSWVAPTGTSSPQNGSFQLASPEGKTFTGRTEWQDYAVSADFLPPPVNGGRVGAGGAAPGGGWGLYCYYQDEDHYLLLRWGGEAAPAEYRHQCQLLGVAQGQKHLLGGVPARFAPDRWHRLQAVVRSHHVRAYVDGQLICAAFVGQLQGGRLGLYGEQAQGLRVDNVTVHFLPPEDPPVRFREQFTKEKTMSSWATAGADWREPLTVAGVYWHRGEFCGDTTVEYLLEGVGRRAFTTALIIGGDGSNDTSGYRLTLTTQPQDRRLQGEIYRQGQRVAQATMEGAKAPTHRVRFARRDGYLVGSVEDTPFIGFYDPQPLTGRHVGLVAQDNEHLRFDGAAAWSANSFDTTFTGAPTEWHVQKGLWEVTERWKCDPSWTWFGGHGHLTPVLWSKHDYAGDLVLEFYAALQMNQKEPPYYLHPSDLNATICGNGTDLSSGYSFIFAGWENMTSRIIKGHNHILAESNAAPALFDRPDPTGDLNRFHRHWFRIRIEKHGGHLRYTVDDQRIAEVVDPHPLEGGKIALWTVNNGLMIARVRLWYERLAPTTPFPDLAALHAAADPGSPDPSGSARNNDFEHHLGAWQALPTDPPGTTCLSLDDTTAATGRRSLRVTNLTSGGEFAVRALAEPFDAAQDPLLSFAYRLSGRVAVNVHVKALGTWHTLGFTLSSEGATASRWLGQLPSVGFDNQWRPAQFNLGTALRKFHPDGPLLVEEIVFANRSSDRYLFAGFGGNGYGTTYYVDDFRIGEGEG